MAIRTYRAAVLLLLVGPLIAPAGARSCPPRASYDVARDWIRNTLQCERHNTPLSSWIEWAEYCPDGQHGFFFLKVKTGGGKEYLYERMPRAVFDGFKGAPSAGTFYNREIKARYGFDLGRLDCE
jgi:hypothetical protein